MDNKDILVTKFRNMERDLRFLEFAWNGIPQEWRDFLLNDYAGPVPAKYNR